jgi:hypothetical protein
MLNEAAVNRHFIEHSMFDVGCSMFVFFPRAVKAYPVASSTRRQ